MSIIKMEKVSILGLDESKETLISKLMDLGVVEISDQTTALADERIAAVAEKDGNETVAMALDAQVNRVGIALDTLKAHGTIKKPFFQTRRVISRKQFWKIVAREEQISENVDTVMELNDRLHTMQETINKCNVDLASLAPWRKYDLPLEIRETEHCDVDLGVIPVTMDFEELRQTINSENDISILEEINEDKNFRYVVMISTKRESGDFIQLLKKWGYTPVPFEDFHGTVTENQERLEKTIREAESEMALLENQISRCSYMIEDMETFYDALVMRRDSERLKSSLIRTKRTFALKGWVPVPAKADIARVLEEMGCYFEFAEPEEGEKPPVAIQTNRFSGPFEAVTEMYSLPDYDGFDSTNIMSLFYACFFGLMLSDAGYGLVMFLGCAFILKKYPLEHTMGKMFRMFRTCGLFTIFWGVLFGSYFGDLIQTWASTVFGKTITIAPLWFSPMENPTKLLIFSLLFGVIHLFTAMGLDIYMKVKRGQAFDAFCDDVIWYIVIVGAGLWLAGGQFSAGAPTVGKYMTIAGAVLLLLTGGRHNKGIGKVTGGLAALYNVTGWISDILSYARLLALGLATGVIASVVNLMGSMLGTGFKGAIALLIVGIFGHVFSMAINVLGAFVHSCRLQYVEFFGKFYEDGGEPFKPFVKDTQFIRLLDKNEEEK